MRRKKARILAGLLLNDCGVESARRASPGVSDRVLEFRTCGSGERIHVDRVTKVKDSTAALYLPIFTLLEREIITASIFLFSLFSSWRTSGLSRSTQRGQTSHADAERHMQRLSGVVLRSLRVTQAVTE